MNPDDPAAHSPREGDDWTKAHPLREHLKSVAGLARQAATAFGAGEWAEIAGLWHDLGKYRPSFQLYIRGTKGLEKSHKLAGAFLAKETKTAAGDLIAFAIAGHHGGLPRAFGTHPALNDIDSQGELELNEALTSGCPTDLVQRAIPAMGEPLRQRLAALAQSDRPIAVELLTRFIFSALVDGDYRDTAAFYDPTAEQARRQAILLQADIPTLRQRLDARLDHLMAGAPPSEVNRHRRAILDECRRAAKQPQGIFDLTVPTGGGKTLAALSFALRHAERHDLRRVIIVLPFTAIIEQNAKVCAEILGHENVLEHHGAFDIDSGRMEKALKDAGFDPTSFGHRHKLLTENWDAPVIVTTSVQFLESLHANTPERCRKLHHLARSVVILDEAQTIPAHLLDCTLDSLRVLSACFDLTLVSCTATQPALHQRSRADGTNQSGLGSPTAIITDPIPLFSALERVRVEWPADPSTPTPWESLADDLRTHEQVLAIVHRRQDAVTLARLVGDDCLHLSALMLPDHRRQVLDEVRRRLNNAEPCRLVATQLIEAGVDVDFPVVYRALAGVDSLAQAAGRCNREGRLGHRGGRFVVFIAASEPPRGILATAAGTTRVLLARGPVDLADPELYRRFYGLLYDTVDTDAKNLAGLRRDRDFPAIAERYRLIDDGGQLPVVIDWPQLDPATLAAIRNLSAGHPQAADWSRIRKASIQVPRAIATRWLGKHILSLPRGHEHPTPILHLADWPDRYDQRLGLQIWDDPHLDASQVVL